MHGHESVRALMMVIMMGIMMFFFSPFQRFAMNVLNPIVLHLVFFCFLLLLVLFFILNSLVYLSISVYNSFSMHIVQWKLLMELNGFFVVVVVVVFVLLFHWIISL